ncbi:hypothetical protein ATKI12_3739 [Kitasatospora sp. Ki12]
MTRHHVIEEWQSWRVTTTSPGEIRNRRPPAGAPGAPQP